MTQKSINQEVSDKVAELTVEQVEKWLTEDLGRARSLLQAIHDDKNILRLVAMHMHGKVQNWNEKQKVLKEQEVEG